MSEHRANNSLHTGGVTGSIPVAPTSQPLGNAGNTSDGRGGHSGSGELHDLLTLRAMGLGAEGQMTHAQWEQHCSDTPGLREAWERDARNPGRVEQPAWRLIDDNTPADVCLILGWWSTSWGFDPEWEVETGFARSLVGGWWHGSATHWLPMSVLPASPVTGAGDE